MDQVGEVVKNKETRVDLQCTPLFLPQGRLAKHNSSDEGHKQLGGKSREPAYLAKDGSASARIIFIKCTMH